MKNGREERRAGKRGKKIYRVRIIYCVCVLRGCSHNKYTPQAQIEETLRLEQDNAC